MSEVQQTQILAERQDVAAEWDPEYGDRHIHNLSLLVPT